jgi:NADPH:quinone reductase-like Zn-dependent oxidoreductase
MKAVVFTEYGPPDVLRLEEIAKPAPEADQVLVKVFATTVNYGDLVARKLGHLASREFNMPAFLLLPSRMALGWNKPRHNILGSELAGQVEAVGGRVTKFKPGDQVFAYTGMGMGANAEYIRLPETGTIALKPANMSYEEAATLPYGAVMAVSLLKRADVQPGQSVLINGASGGIGAMAVQLAKSDGAEVTGVCGAPRLEYVKSLGADHVLDYAHQDFTRNGEKYDLILDILGRSSYSRCRGSLKARGLYLPVSFKSRALFDMLWTSLAGRGQRVVCAMAGEKAESLVFVKGLAEAGKVKAVIDRRFPLERTAEAHRYVEQGQRQGQVVITVA